MNLPCFRLFFLLVVVVLLGRSLPASALNTAQCGSFVRLNSNEDFARRWHVHGNDLSRVEFHYSNQDSLRRFFMNRQAQLKVKALRLVPTQFQWSAPDFRMLKSFYQLQELDLENNDLGAAGASALTEALGEGSVIQTLNLNDNDIGTEGLREIMQPLFSLKKLIRLELRGNDLDAENVSQLRKRLPAVHLIF